MDAITTALLTNPIHYIGVLLACFAAAGLLYFLAGLFGGLPNVFHMHGHDEHIHHARVRVVQGLLLMMAVFGIWQIIRVLLGEAPGSTIILALLVLIPVWYPWLKSLFGGGGGH